MTLVLNTAHLMEGTSQLPLPMSEVYSPCFVVNQMVWVSVKELEAQGITHKLAVFRRRCFIYIYTVYIGIYIYTLCIYIYCTYICIYIIFSLLVKC